MKLIFQVKYNNGVKLIVKSVASKKKKLKNVNNVTF